MIFIINFFSSVLLLCFCSSTFAATYINFTRLILNGNEREVTFNIKSEDNNAVLMQLWTDRDNMLDKPETIKMPFLIQPPVFRLNGRDSRTVRLQFIGDQNALPADRESLFWLNALEIPQKANSKDGEALLQIAFRTRIKIFYRPLALTKLNVESEVKKIQISKVNCEDKLCIRLENKSPLHYTLLNIKLESGREIAQLPAEGIIAPFSSLNIPLGKSVTVNENIKSFTWVDDYGVERINIK